MTAGKWKNGIWIPTIRNPKGTNQHTKKEKATEKPLKPTELPVDEQLKRYQRLCHIRQKQQEIKLKVAEDMAEYRSLSQEAGRLLE